MLKIKDIIDEIILENPFLEDAIYNSYLNLSSFAEYIKPQIEKISKKEVTVASIKMTLSRISLESSKRKYFRFNHDNLFIRKNISLINIEKTKENNLLINKIYENIENISCEYFAVIQGVNEIDIVYSNKIEGIIEKIIPSNRVNLTLKNLSLIGIHLNEEVLYSKGLFYNLSKKLFFYDINILQVISTYKEIAIILESKDIKKALEIL